MRNSTTLAITTKRHAMAPIEFVMGLPFLMLLFGLIFTLGRVTLEQSDSAITARHEGWKKRSDSSTWANDDLSIKASMVADTGRADGDGERSVKVYSWLGGSIDTDSKNTVLSGTWDSDQVQAFDKEEPHLSIMEKMIGGDGKVAQSVSKLIHTLLSMGSLPNQSDINQAEQDKNNQQEQLKEKQKQMQDKINKLKGELNKLIEDRNKLQDEYNKQSDDRMDLIDEQNDLLMQAAMFPEGSPERDDLEAQADALDSDIQALDKSMADLKKQIDVKNGEIADKKEEIRVVEDAQQQSQDEIDKLPQ